MPARRKSATAKVNLTATFRETSLEDHLLAILGKYVGETGESEGAVDTLKRLIAERDAFALKLARGGT